MSLSTHPLYPALSPRSVAVVGATAKQGKLGRHVLDNLVQGEFKGPVFAVNPKYREIDGRPCVASLRDLPEAPDLAVVVTPANRVLSVIDDAGARGVRHLLVLSAGFAETGEEGQRLQRRMLEQARREKVRILGPNCLGLMRPQIGLNASFARRPAVQGGVALVSQSGAVMAALLDYAAAEKFGFSSVVSTGASADIDFPELLDFLALDPATRSIVLYMEGVHDARAFMSSMRAAASVKPVVVLKVGRHLAGSRAALSHTGALVGDDAVFDAAVRRAGALRVERYDQLLAAAQTLASGRLPQTLAGSRLAIVTNGGGPGVLAADAVTDAGRQDARQGLALASLGAATLRALDAQLPATWSRANPIDIIGDADADRFARALRTVLADDGVDGVLTLFCPTIVLSAEAAAQALLPVAGQTNKPVVTVWLGRQDAEHGRRIAEEARVPALSTPEQGVEAFLHLTAFARHRELRLQAPPPVSSHIAVDLLQARQLVADAQACGRSRLDEQAALALLRAFGIDHAGGVLACSADEAVAAADRCGYPAVLKVRADGVSHKSDVGGVLLDLPSADAVRQGFDLLRSRVSERAPQARFVGALVQPLVRRPQGRELMIGLARDPVFGPVISFGMGGLAVEILRDTAIALPPLNKVLAADLIERTRAARLLGVFRNMPAADIHTVMDVLMRVSLMACEIPCIYELDINPVLADAQGAVALDARVVLGPGTLQPDARYSHLAIHPYPVHLESSLSTRDGRTLELRPIRPEDAEAEKRFVSRLSPRSRFLRFHGPLRELTQERLVRYTQIDYDREMALIAVDAESEIRGVARYIRNPDGFSCEFGFAVEDAWQGLGVGSALMDALERCAYQRGLKEIVGLVLEENLGACRLLRKRGYSSKADADDPLVLHYTKSLP